MKRPKPNVFEYLDLSTYLKSYYLFRKQYGQKFSYEAWSAELGFNKSRSFLRMVLIGKKKASKSFVDAFTASALESAAEREYFECLVKFSQSPTVSEREIYGKKLIEILRSNLPVKKIENSPDFVSTILLPRLFTIATFKDIEPTAGSFSKILEIEENQIIQSLKILEEMGLVISDGEGREKIYRTTTDRFRVPDNKGNLNLLSFHEASLKEAVCAFTKPKELRSYKSLFLAMDEEELKNFYAAMNAFASELLAKHTPADLSGRRVFQVNFNNYPVSADPTNKSESGAGQETAPGKDL